MKSTTPTDDNSAKRGQSRMMKSKQMKRIDRFINQQNERTSFKLAPQFPNSKDNG